MTDLRRLGQIILARIAAEVPEFGGRVLDKATETTAFPYVTLGAMYGAEGDVECVRADDWTVQVDVWDRNTSKLKMAELAGKVRRALKGWSDTDEVTMHPLRVGPPRIMDDPDLRTVHAVLLVEVILEDGPTQPEN